MEHEFSWHPGIGDPTIGGWVTVALYLIASLSCWRTAAFVRREDRNHRSDFNIWRTISLCFFFLSINKQLDLQSAITEIGRLVAFSGGWYEQRRTVQVDFIISAAVVCLAAVPAVIFWARKSPTQTWFALVGSIFVLGYVIIRAASFHHFDGFISSRYLGFKWNWILEMTGIAMVLFASEWRRMKAISKVPGRVAN